MEKIIFALMLPLLDNRDVLDPRAGYPIKCRKLVVCGNVLSDINPIVPEPKGIAKSVPKCKIWAIFTCGH